MNNFDVIVFILIISIILWLALVLRALMSIDSTLKCIHSMVLGMRLDSTDIVKYNHNVVHKLSLILNELYSKRE